MEAKNLMLGDWVMYPGQTPFKIDSIEFDRVYFVRDEYGNQIAVTDLTPIPLTEEILKANGFVNKNPDVTRKTLTNDFGNHKSVVFVVPNHRVHIYNDSHQILNVKISYVHELQHALRLCGFDEVADSFKIG